MKKITNSKMARTPYGKSMTQHNGGPVCSSARTAVLRRRRYAIDGVHTLKVEGPGEGTFQRQGDKAKNRRTVTIGLPDGNGVGDPCRQVSKAIRDALDPDKAPKPVRTMKDMTLAEQEEMQRLYGRK